MVPEILIITGLKARFLNLTGFVITNKVSYILYQYVKSATGRNPTYLKIITYIYTKKKGKKKKMKMKTIQIIEICTDDIKHYCLNISRVLQLYLFDLEALLT